MPQSVGDVKRCESRTEVLIALEASSPIALPLERPGSRRFFSARLFFANFL
jgi:hypothetical protein